MLEQPEFVEVRAIFYLGYDQYQIGGGGGALRIVIRFRH